MKRTVVIKSLKNITVIISLFLVFGNAFAEEWGKIMYPHAKTNIRAKRNSSSPVTGKLPAGKPVKVDFLLHNWYAVFTLSEKERDERKALGYVYASTLFEEIKKTNAGKKDIQNKLPEISQYSQDYAPISVKNITFKPDQEGKETVSIELNRYYLPAILSLGGENPRVVIDVTNADSMNKEWSLIKVQGKLIKQIRTSLLKEGKIVRIVLDMEPKKSYFVSPVFSESDNIYSLEITEYKK